MQHYAVIGDPIAHSLSPVIYNTLFGYYGIDADFTACRIRKGHVEDVLSLELDGFACTMPHKQDIIPYLSSLSKEAGDMNSVNIVKRDADGLHGYSTDGDGLCNAISAAGHKLKQNVLIIGSGGAARSAAYALKANGARVNVFGRNRDKVRALCSELQVYPVDHVDLFAVAYSTDILINATPQGMAGNADFKNLDFLKYLPHTAVVCDMVYNPVLTKLLIASRTMSLATVCGIDMLLHQAYIAFSLWTGIEVDVAAVEGMLKGNMQSGTAGR